MISAVVTSYNEAKKLENCLNSVKDFADEIILIDLFSNDETNDVCKKFKVKVFKHKQVPYVELIRNFAISKASGSWILILDPDEIIGESLKERLKEMTKRDEFDAVNIPRKNIFFNKWIRHTNWWPDKHIRFFKKGKVEWETRLHSYPKVSGEILELESREDLAIMHYGYDNIREFIDRQNRYSEIEAEQALEKGEKFSEINFFWWPVREFLVRYIKHAGFLDGIYGFSLSFLMAVERITVQTKIWEKEQKE